MSLLSLWLWTTCYSSYHSSINPTVQLNFSVPDFMLSHKVYLKPCINWDHAKNYISAINWRNIYKANFCVSFLTSKLSDIIASRVLLRWSRDKSWFTVECREVLQNKQSTYKLWSSIYSISWDNYSHARRTAEINYNNHLK